MNDHYSHRAWLDSVNESIRLLTGDEEALAGLRAAVRDRTGADDVTDDAPIYLWNGVWIKGGDDSSHAVPDDIRDRFVEMRPFPQDPIARMPSAPAGPTRRDELMTASAEAEGDPKAIEIAIARTRLYHEVPAALFPGDGALRWFKNGLHVVGHGDDPSVFQTPMDRVEEMIVPREHPKLPYLRVPSPGTVRTRY